MRVRYIGNVPVYLGYARVMMKPGDISHPLPVETLFDKYLVADMDSGRVHVLLDAEEESYLTRLMEHLANPPEPQTPITPKTPDERFRERVEAATRAKAKADELARRSTPAMKHPDHPGDDAGNSNDNSTGKPGSKAAKPKSKTKADAEIQLDETGVPLSLAEIQKQNRK